MISDRIREQRAAAGLSQQALADRCGISLRSQQNYEKGDRSPDAEYLAALASLQLDVLYVLTGIADPSALGLDASERVLLDSYRTCPPQARQNLIQTAVLLAAGVAPPPVAEEKPASVVKVSAKGGYAAGRDMNINDNKGERESEQKAKRRKPAGPRSGA